MAELDKNTKHNIENSKEESCIEGVKKLEKAYSSYRLSGDSSKASDITTALENLYKLELPPLVSTISDDGIVTHPSVVPNLDKES